MTGSDSRAAKRPLQPSEALGRVGTSVTFVELITANLRIVRIPVASRGRYAAPAALRGNRERRRYPPREGLLIGKVEREEEEKEKLIIRAIMHILPRLRQLPRGTGTENVRP
jgi:hypothetical protein